MKKTLALLAFLAPAALYAAQIENKILTVKFDDATQTFSVASRETGRTFVASARLEGGAASATTGRRKIIIAQAGGSTVTLELRGNEPFLFITRELRNADINTVDLRRVTPISFTVGLEAPAENLRTLGTGGLLAPDKNPGSYLFLACADPATRHGVVAGWLTEDRGSGVFFSSVTNGRVQVTAQIDYGHLRIPPGNSAVLETLVLGYFADARLGLEQYADAIRKQYNIHLREPSAVYCSWYAEKHGQAGDEKSTVELAKFVAKELKPFGLGVVQIDDEWQDGPKPNGPRRGFDRVRTNGPYAHGIAPVAAAVEKEGLTFGLWWLPFARNYQDPEYRDRQDWFVKRDNGKPFDTAWGGTCLDLTHPDVQAQLTRIARLYRHDWGVKYYKMDGLWTGAACEQIYVNDGYKDDHFGNNQPFRNPLVSNVESYRNGLKLLRQAAGDDVFFSGCCIAQNMRELSAIGLVDSMRIGPDYNADKQGIRTGPIRGSRLYFLNGRVWWNDPDPAKVRASHAASSADAAATGAVTLEAARLGASWVAIAGQFFLVSDWLPDLPAGRLDVLKRTVQMHHAIARPVDYFDNFLPTTWLVTATNGTVRRDVIGLFNWNTNAQTLGATLGQSGLDPARTYYAFDFWGNSLLPDITNSFAYELPPASCKIIAVRAAERHPVLLSTSRHVTQGIVDVTGEKWSGNTLSGVSQVIAGDAYELRLRVPVGWKFDSASAPATESPGFVRITLRSDKTQKMKWSASFRPLPN
ncbi:MAG: alpha-galactosidase [Verrucomicrobiota bacterium]